MSGIEVVGIVLAVIPLVISALEHYKDGEDALFTWRKNGRSLRSIIRNLEAENCRLRNACERLLIGTVSSTKLKPILDGNLGFMWQDEEIEKAVQRRLDRSYCSFQRTIEEMFDIIENLKLKLGVDTNRQPAWYTSRPINSITWRVSHMVNSSVYKETLKELSSMNGILESIVKSSLELEPFHMARSQGDYLEPFRRIISSAYRALQLGLSGTCQQKHRMSLQLISPGQELRGDEGTIIRKLHFSLILSHHTAGVTNPRSLAWTWEKVKLKVDVSSEHQKLGAPLPESSSTEVREKRKATKSVRILLGGSRQTTNHQAESPKLLDASNANRPASPNLVTNELCRALGMYDLGGEACGYVKDKSVHDYGLFGVTRAGNISDKSCKLTFISIRDSIVGGYRKSIPGLPQQLFLASSIASGTLQLQRTPWLPMTMTSGKLYLAEFDGQEDFNRVYVSGMVPEDPCGDSTGAAMRDEESGNELMWALFVLLIEVILWMTMDDILSEIPTIHVAGAHPREIFNLRTDRGSETARKLLDRVAGFAGPEYGNAVQECQRLASCYPRLDLGEKKFLQHIYHKIVIPIEESCERCL